MTDHPQELRATKPSQAPPTGRSWNSPNSTAYDGSIREHRQYIADHGQDLPEIQNWK